MAKTKRAVVKPTTIEPAVKTQPERGKKARGSEPAPHRWRAIAGVAGALLLSLIIYGLRLNKIIGHPFVDDAYYVLLAKALATGQGFTLINTPSPGIMPLYPPGFPWLLSLVYRLSPQFPQNLWLLKSVSLVAVLGAGVVAYRYFVRYRGLPPYLAFGIVMATVLNPALVHFATSTVMSECVFTLVQLLTIIVIERCVSLKGAWRYALLGAALASFAFLTRSVGVTLVAATVAYLLKERLLRAAMIFVAGTVLCVGPWMIYSRLHTPTPAQRQEQKGYILESYATQFWQRSAGDIDSGTISLGELPARIWKNTAEIMGQDFGVLVASRLLPILGPTVMALLSFLLSALAILGFVATVRERITVAEITVLLSLMITVAWPWAPLRFILPLTPFLVFYLLMGLRAIYRWRRRGSGMMDPRAQWVLLAVAAWLIVAGNVVTHLDYIQRLDDPSFKSRGETAAFEEIETMLQWSRERLPAEEVFASLNPPLVHLYTGHKTISAQDPVESWETWNRLGVRYLVLTSPYGVPERDSAGRKITTVYQSRRDPHLRVVDLGPPSSRAPWGSAAASAPK